MTKSMLVLLSATALLAGCATAKPDAAPATCNPEPAQSWIGKPANDANVQAAFKASGAKTLRSLKPGQPMTMDYRVDRVNVMQDGNGMIEKITCG